MFDKSAIKELSESEAISAAQSAIVEAFHPGLGLVALPDEFKNHDLEAYLHKRRRARGTMETNSVSDFAKYSNEHKEDGATVFIDQVAMKAVAVLNLGTPDNPGHTDNRAVLIAKQTVAYGTLLRHACTLNQSQAGEFFEDWAPMLSFFDEDESTIELKKAISAVRKLTIESARKVESEEQQLSATRSAFESVKATSKDTIPAKISFTTEPYFGLKERTFHVRLSITTTGDSPKIILRIINLEQHEEEMAEELANLVRDSGIEAPVLIGKYAVSK